MFLCCRFDFSARVWLHWPAFRGIFVVNEWENDQPALRLLEFILPMFTIRIRQRGCCILYANIGVKPAKEWNRTTEKESKKRLTTVEEKKVIWCWEHRTKFCLTDCVSNLDTIQIWINTGCWWRKKVLTILWHWGKVMRQWKYWTNKRMEGKNNSKIIDKWKPQAAAAPMVDINACGYTGCPVFEL